MAAIATTRAWRRFAFTLVGMAIVAATAACAGAPGTPNGSVVGYPGSGSPPPSTSLVSAQVTITVPRTTTTHTTTTHISTARARQPRYLSTATQSLSIALASVNGTAVNGVSATTIDTYAGAPNCTSEGASIVCVATIEAASGDDLFTVTTYAWPNATGAILSVGTVHATIGSSGGSFGISKTLSLSLDGIIASLALHVERGSVDRGKPASVPVTLQAFDAGGAQIVGPSLFQSPIALTIQGDSVNAFALRAGSAHGATLSIVKPAGAIDLTYDGNKQATPITLQASVDGPTTAGAHAALALRGSPPPASGGTIYVLNAGSKNGQDASVTVYDGTGNGNAAPIRTLQLSSSLFARSIAVDAKGNLYVGYLDSALGFAPATGTPDTGNEIAVFAPGASGNVQPATILKADSATQSALFPTAIAFDAAGDLVTYGATAVDGNTGDAVLVYAPDSSGAVAPIDGWNFGTPQVRYPGPTGLALDAGGNFYVNGALATSLGPSDGVFVASASERDNPLASPARTVPWDATTQLVAGQVSNIALDQSGEIYVANFVLQGTPTTCQAQVNVFAAGATGGTTDVAPLRVLQLTGIASTNSQCYFPTNPLTPFFPTIAVYGSSIYVADDFGNAIDVFPTSANGSVSPTQTIGGTATGLNTPIDVTISSTTVKGNHS